VDAIEARRLRPGEDHVDATVAQVTDLLGDLAATGRRRPADPPPLVMLDAGYPATDLSHALAGLPVQLLVRLRSDRVFYAPGGRRADGKPGRPRRHGQRFALAEAGTHHAPDIELAGESRRYGKVRVRAWKGLHQALERSGRWSGFPECQELPIVPGTVIQVSVERLPGGRAPHKDPVAMAPRAGGSGRRPDGPAVEGLSPPVRSRAFPPVRQGIPGPGRRPPGLGRVHRPVDGPDHRRLYPAAAGLSPRR